MPKIMFILLIVILYSRRLAVKKLFYCKNRIVSNLFSGISRNRRRHMRVSIYVQLCRI